VQIPGPKFRVVPIKGLQRSYRMAFLPDGRILVTERAGRVRIISGNAVDPQPVSGVPPVLNRNQRGMNDIALYPKFRENGWVYFTYYKPHPTETDAATATLARGKYDGAHALTDVKDIFTADTYVTGPSSAKILFAPDGTLFMAIGVPIPPRRPGIATPLDAQSPGSLYGKILRLTDAGGVPPDNPFVGKAGYRGEIYAMGIRNAMGLAINPKNGVALTGLAFYTGDKFPEWRDSVFVGAMVGEQVQRIVFNLRGLPIRRDPLIWELGQRIRDVQQGPDGLL
jgi:aldose sugar dehydrogenase